jgi:hypothetical protein
VRTSADRSRRPALRIQCAASGFARNGDMRTMDEQDRLKQKLAELKSEHRDLDDVINRLLEQRPVDLIQMQRLKKRKLVLKDLIAKIESMLLPDIIA